MLRFEAIAHNTAELRCGRMIEKFSEIASRLAGVVERFATALDCVDTGLRADTLFSEDAIGLIHNASRWSPLRGLQPGSACADRRVRR